MDIQYLGHSSFKLSFKAASVVIDPFDPQMVGFSFPKVNAEIVTLSHNHGDHNNYEAVADVRKVIKGPGEYEIEGISIAGVASFHDDKKGEERGRNTMYVFEADDVRIVHLGDLGHKLSESQAESLGEVDVLMVPVGGVYTIDANTAVEVVQSIEPEIIIPMHYKTDAHKAETFSELTPVETFLNALSIKTTNEKKLTVKSTDLTGEDQRVVVLDSK